MRIYEFMRLSFCNSLGYYCISSYFENAIPQSAGCWWDPHLELWRCGEEAARRLGMFADKHATRALAPVDVPTTPEHAAVPAPDGKEFYSYQLEGIAHAVANERALNADEMGLGKTVQAIGMLSMIGARRVLVVCPASLRINWQREIVAWGVGLPDVFLPAKPTVLPTTDGIYVFSYDALRKLPATLTYDAIIFDESHRLKNGKTKQAKAAAQHVRKASRVMMLTGTPVLNRPAELYNQLRLLLGSKFTGIFGDWLGFHTRYCAAKQTRFGWDVSGSRNLKELGDTLRSTCMIRRLKADVLTELPAKTRKIVVLKTRKSTKPEKELLDKLQGLEIQDAIKLLSKPASVEFETVSELRLAEGMDKIDDAISYIEDVVDSAGNCIVFAHHKAVIAALVAGLPGAVSITGGMSEGARQASIDAFQGGKASVIVCSILAASVGITLHAASNVVVVEGAWEPGTLMQAEDRAHRIGQKDAVEIHYLTCEGGVDHYMLNMCIHKMKVQDKIFST